MSELKIGKMTSQDLANWFGISLKTYLNARKRKLDILKVFADFQEFRGYVNITKIHIPVYCKKSEIILSISDKEFTSGHGWHKSGFDTCARAATEIYRNSPELQKLCSEDCFKHYYCLTRIKYYGHVDRVGDEGLWGTCSYALVRKNNWNEIEPLSDEEMAIVQEINHKWYGNVEEELPLIAMSVKNNELDEKNAQADINGLVNLDDVLTNYDHWLEEMSERIQCFTKVTKLDTRAWKYTEEKYINRKEKKKKKEN